MLLIFVWTGLLEFLDERGFLLGFGTGVGNIVINPAFSVFIIVKILQKLISLLIILLFHIQQFLNMITQHQHHNAKHHIHINQRPLLYQQLIDYILRCIQR